ncbi:amino acid permease C-terminal domain-containing protein [Streptomyces sp. NPDC054933]
MVNTWIVAALVAVLAAVVPLDGTVNLTTIGTLAVMAVVNVCVISLRLRRPGLRRSFSVPLYPVSPLLGVGFCLYLVYGLGGATWLQFAGYLIAGALVYAVYGRGRSRLAGSG